MGWSWRIGSRPHYLEVLTALWIGSRPHYLELLTALWIGSRPHYLEVLTALYLRYCSGLTKSDIKNGGNQRVLEYWFTFWSYCDDSFFDFSRNWLRRWNQSLTEVVMTSTLPEVVSEQVVISKKAYQTMVGTLWWQVHYQKYQYTN